MPNFAKVIVLLSWRIAIVGLRDKSCGLQLCGTQSLKSFTLRFERWARHTAVKAHFRQHQAHLHAICAKSLLGIKNTIFSHSIFGAVFSLESVAILQLSAFENSMKSRSLARPSGPTAHAKNAPSKKLWASFIRE